MPAPVPSLRCRQIGEADIAAVAALWLLREPAFARGARFALLALVLAGIDGRASNYKWKTLIESPTP